MQDIFNKIANLTKPSGGYKEIAPFQFEIWETICGVRMYAVTNDIQVATSQQKREQVVRQHNQWKIKNLKNQ